MSKVLVMGPVYVETTVKVKKFPLDNGPVIFDKNGIKSGLSGHGFNVSRALKTLGNDIDFISVTGNDSLSKTVINSMEQLGVEADNIVASLSETPQQIILYDDESLQRQIIADLKESTEVELDTVTFEENIKNCDIAALCNSNYCRPFFDMAKEAGKKIFTDVHGATGVDDEYNKEFMEKADVLFLSHENIGDDYEFVMREIAKKYGNEIVVMGLAEKGAAMYVKADDAFVPYRTVKTRKIVSTMGAGDSMFSAFVHFYTKTQNPYYAIKAAILFASYKIGSASASKGFLTEEQLEFFYGTIWK